VGIRIDDMAQCSVKGPHLVMYNANGHVYRGIDELVELWRSLATTIELTRCVDLTEPAVEGFGDVALLTVDEAVMDIRTIGDAGLASSTVGAADEQQPTECFRSTELYKGDDGESRPEWRIWHCNYNNVAGEDEPRSGQS
jgi:hypothetical protein